jgi:hypothetical protein
MAGSPPPRARPFWRRPAVLLAIVLDVVVAIGALWALMNGFGPIVVIAFAVILGIAPWSAIIDEGERTRRR